MFHNSASDYSTIVNFSANKIASRESGANLKTNQLYLV